MKQDNITWFDGYLPYVVKEVVLACPDCGRDIETLVAISLDNVGTPFLKAVKVCKCGYMPTLDELLEELD